MSLTPTNLFNVGSSLPTLFFEARIHGGNSPDELITQLGLSLTSNNVDVALFTRTSGVVLIAGVGSYCAYRICSRYFGKELVWTLMDAARLDRLSHADSRLLHPAAEGLLTSRQSNTFYEELARQRLCKLLRSLSEDDKAISAGGLSILGGSSGHGSIAVSNAGSRSSQKQRYRLLSTRSGSPIRVVCTTNPTLRRAMQKSADRRRTSDSDRAGLAAIRWESPGQEKRTLNTRTHVPLQNEDDRCDALSDLTSVSRIQPPPAALLRTDCCTDVDGDPIGDYEDDENMDNWSRSSYRRSTGDPLSWDDEFNAASVTNPLFRCASSSNISELSAMKNLEEMWAQDEQKGMSSSAASLIMRLNDDDTSSCCAYNLAELIESKCSVRSSSYMYKSVHVDDTIGSEVGSTLSATNQSVLSANFTANLRSHGLWEPTSRPTSEKNTTEHSLQVDTSTSSSRLMTDSYISKSSSSSRSKRKSAMFDSGIGTNFISSDDDKSSLNGHTIKSTAENSEKPRNEEDSSLKTPTAKPTVKRSWLDKISEKPSPQHRPRRASAVSSVAPSEQSLEWFDELSNNQQQKITITLDEEEGTPI